MRGVRVFDIAEERTCQRAAKTARAQNLLRAFQRHIRARIHAFAVGVIQIPKLPHFTQYWRFGAIGLNLFIVGAGRIFRLPALDNIARRRRRDSPRRIGEQIFQFRNGISTDRTAGKFCDGIVNASYLLDIARRNFNKRLNRNFSCRRTCRRRCRQSSLARCLCRIRAVKNNGSRNARNLNCYRFTHWTTPATTLNSPPTRTCSVPPLGVR